MSRAEAVPPEFIRRIVDELHPLQIWLFGSRAEDLELVPLWQRLRDLHAQRVELFPITKSEFDEWRGSLGTLPQIVSSEGVVVYAR